MTQGTDDTRAHRSRPVWLAALAMVVVAAVVTAAWVLHGSGPAPVDTLRVSSQQAPSGSGSPSVPAAGTGSSGKDPSSAGHAKLTPAGVAQPAPSQRVAERPRQVTLASGTTMRVRVSSTASNGELEIPVNIKQAGWWDGSSRLADPYGAIVVAAHVDSFTQGLGRFAELLSMHPGDVIHLDGAALAQKYTVVSAHLVPKSSISASSDIFSVHGQPRLVLITCGGAYTSGGGYQSNMVVVAEPDGPLHSR